MQRNSFVYIFRLFQVSAPIHSDATSSIASLMLIIVCLDMYTVSPSLNWRPLVSNMDWKTILLNELTMQSAYRCL